MTAATAPMILPRTPSATRPAPRPARLPVFVNDCVTPLGDTTLLALLLRAADQDR